MLMKRKMTVLMLFVMKCLTFAYILTGILLLLLAMLLYKFQLTENAVNILMVVIYILVCFFAGFITGKKAVCRRFLWGAFMGIAYFLVLFVISWIAGQSFPEMSVKFGSTFFLCMGSGMLGGMVSGSVS